MERSDSMTSVRKLLNSAPACLPFNLSSPSVSPGAASSTNSASPVPEDMKTITKPSSNKRKAAFEAWHEKKLAEISKGGDDAKQPKQSRIESTPPPPTSASNPLLIAQNPCDLITQLMTNSLPSIISNISPNSSPLTQQQQNPGNWLVRKNLTAPKLSRHNDAAYYPNIQCILCNEWVCSRNRYMHIESHLQYRPYKCSVCGYDNRKEIFINLHIKRTHQNNAKVLYHPDPDLEHRAWQLAEQCLQHTREILTKEDKQTSSPKEPKFETKPAPALKPKIDTSLLAPYADVYRPKIFNSQRAEKSQLIEESRQLGLVPDFSEVASMESQCCLCGAHILSHHAVLEEHVRTHLLTPSYRCNIEGCTTEHHSKNFLNRHMKEVHKYRRAPCDLLEQKPELVVHLNKMCVQAFPLFFNENGTHKSRQHRSLVPPIPTMVPKLEPNLERELNKNQQSCGLCKVQMENDYVKIYGHVKSHLSIAPYGCKLCHVTDVNKQVVLDHIIAKHHGHKPIDVLRNRMKPDIAQQSHLLLSICFPNAKIQPWMHDEICYD